MPSSETRGIKTACAFWTLSHALHFLPITYFLICVPWNVRLRAWIVKFPHYVISSNYLVYFMFKDKYFAMVRSRTPPVCPYLVRCYVLRRWKQKKVMTFRFFFFTKEENHQTTLMWTVASNVEINKTLGTFLSLFTSTPSNITPASLCFVMQFLHTTRPTLLDPSTPASAFTSFPDTSKLAWKCFLPTLWKKTLNLLMSPQNPTGFQYLIHEVFELV